MLSEVFYTHRTLPKYVVQLISKIQKLSKNISKLQKSNLE